MGDFLVKYKTIYDDIEIAEETLLYIEEDIEDEELLEEVLVEKLKEELECDVDLVWFESLVDKMVNVEEIY